MEQGGKLTPLEDLQIDIIIQEKQYGRPLSLMESKALGARVKWEMDIVDWGLLVDVDLC